MSSLTRTLTVEEELCHESFVWLYNRHVIAESEFFNTNYNRAILVPVYEEGALKMAAIVPRVTLQYLDRLIEAVDEREHLLSMECVSHLYKTGIGLPRHERLAEIWKQYSNLNPVYQDFDKVVRKLRSHVADAQRNSPDGIYAYMADFHMVDTVLRSALNSHTVEHAGQISKVYAKAVRRGLLPEFESLTAVMAIEGVDVSLVYRKMLDGSIVLVDGVIHEDNEDSYTDLVTFPYLQQVRTVPSELANGDKGLVDRIRKLTSTDVNTIVVTGTLVVPKDKLRRLRKSIPGVKTTRDLVHYWLEDWIEARDQIEEPAELEALRKDYDLYYGTVITDQSSPSFGMFKEGKLHELEAQLKAAKERLTYLQNSTKRKKKWRQASEHYDDIKHRYTALNQAAELAKEKYVACRKGFNDSLRAERESRAERYLEFVATDIFGFTKTWKLVNFGLKQKTNTYISSLRFRTLDHPGMILYGVVPAKNAGNRSTYRKLIKKADSLYGDQYTVKGVFVYPNKTVNIDSRTPKVFVPR